MRNKETKLIEILGIVGITSYICGFAILVLVGASITEPGFSWSGLRILVVSMCSLFLMIVGGGIFWWLAKLFYV